jgi:hypothetical protein
LIKSSDYSARLKSKTQLREKKRRKRLQAESNTAYYCRVILPKARTVNLNYRQEPLSITPKFLILNGSGDPFFTVRGSSTVVNAFADEMVLKVNGETLNNSILFNAVETGCGDGIHIIGVNLPSVDSLTNTRIEILAPSISAMFDIQNWNHSDRP